MEGIEFIAERIVGPEITNCVRLGNYSLMVSRAWGKK